MKEEMILLKTRNIQSNPNQFNQLNKSPSISKRCKPKNLPPLNLTSTLFTHTTYANNISNTTKTTDINFIIITIAINTIIFLIIIIILIKNSTIKPRRNRSYSSAIAKTDHNPESSNPQLQKNKKQIPLNQKTIIKITQTYIKWIQYQTSALPIEYIIQTILTLIKLLDKQDLNVLQEQINIQMKTK